MAHPAAARLAGPAVWTLVGIHGCVTATAPVRVRRGGGRVALTTGRAAARLSPGQPPVPTRSGTSTRPSPPCRTARCLHRLAGGAPAVRLPAAAGATGCSTGCGSPRVRPHPDAGRGRALAPDLLRPVDPPLGLALARAAGCAVGGTGPADLRVRRRFRRPGSRQGLEVRHVDDQLYALSCPAPRPRASDDAQPAASRLRLHPVVPEASPAGRTFPPPPPGSDGDSGLREMPHSCRKRG